jgi:transcriptional/translational regulatory protein YebC/TACO1
MSGHSKWHTIKHKKGALDAKRGKIFTKLIKEITVAARVGGSGDVDQNARLRKVVNDAKGMNMPNEEITYEGYGIGGVAVLVDTMTDNRNRTVAELRHLFSKNGGNLGEAGSVAWMFDKKGYFVVDKAAKSEDELFEIALEAGADDVQDEGEVFEIYTTPESFEAVQIALKNAGIEPQASEISMIPQNYIKLTGDEAKKMLKLYEAIDDNDDVQKVYANFDIDESEME